MKWRVERAGVAPNYIPGWIAYRPNGIGASFPSHPEALAFVDRQVHEERLHQERAMMKLLGARSRVVIQP